MINISKEVSKTFELDNLGDLQKLSDPSSWNEVEEKLESTLKESWDRELGKCPDCHEELNDPTGCPSCNWISPLVDVDPTIC